MTDCTGQKLRPFQLIFFHIRPLGHYLHIIRTCNDSRLPRNTETSLVAGLLSLRLHNSGVDQYMGILPRGVDDHDPLEYPNLRCSKPHAVGLIHGVQHIPDQFSDPGSHLTHRFTLLRQNLIPYFPYVPDCHS